MSGKYYYQKVVEERTYSWEKKIYEDIPTVEKISNSLRNYYIAILQSIVAEQELKMTHSEITINAIKEFIKIFDYWIKMWYLDHSVLAYEEFDIDDYYIEQKRRIEKLMNVTTKQTYDLHWWASNWRKIDEVAPDEFSALLDSISINIKMDEEYGEDTGWDLINEIHKLLHKESLDVSKLIILFEKIRHIEHVSGYMLEMFFFAVFKDSWAEWQRFSEKVSKDVFEFELPIEIQFGYE